MNKFIDSLMKASRRKWFGTNDFEMSIFFFVDCDLKEDIDRTIKNIKLFSEHKHIDIFLIDVSNSSTYHDRLSSLNNIKYFKVEGGFQPEKLCSLLSEKNVVIGVSSNILLNEFFLEYVNDNIFDTTIFLKILDFDNHILFATSRDTLSLLGSYENKKFSFIKGQVIPCDMFTICYDSFKERSFLDFKVFKNAGEEVDLYNNKVINGLWIGDSLSNIEKLSINSFLKNGHDFHLYVYDDIMGIPDGVVVKDANEILDSNKIFKHKIMGEKEGGSVGPEGFAGFSDWFRYSLLYKKGGWWSDLDSVCLRKYDILRPYFFTTLNGKGTWCANGSMKVLKNSLFLNFCIQVCEDKNENIEYLEVGPLLFAKGYIDYNLKYFSITDELFDAWGGDCFMENSDRDLKEVYSVHLYNSEFLKNGIDKNGVFPENSLLERFKREYLTFG